MSRLRWPLAFVTVAILLGSVWANALIGVSGEIGLALYVTVLVTGMGSLIGFAQHELSKP